MAINYDKTFWRNDVTPVNSRNMNHIEDGIKTVTDFANTLEAKVAELDLPVVGIDGSYIKLISQEDGQVSATQQAFDLSLTEATDNNAPTTKAVKDYVDTYGGKIDTITINNVTLPIVNKNVEVSAVRFDINNQELNSTQKANAKTNLDLNNVVNTADSDTPLQNGTTKFTTGGAYTLQQNVMAVDNKLDVNVHIEGDSDEITYNGDTVTKTSPYQNLKTGSTGSREEVIHLANDTTAGMMSYTDYNQIRTNTARIENLEGQTTRLLYTASTSPTQAQIGTFVDNYLISIGITNPQPSDYVGIAVVVADTYHIWHYYNTAGVGWKDDGLDTVSQFTNSIGGIIKGSATDGFVYAENDGTGSVYGWSDLKTRVSNIENNYVTTNTEQTISGLKTFNGELSIIDGSGYTWKIYNTQSILRFQLGSSAYMGISNTGIWTDVLLRPLYDNAKDLGNGTHRWRDLYLSRNLTDGTNNVAINNIVTLDGAQTISGVKAFSVGPILNNGLAINAKDSGGTSRNLIGVNSSNRIELGSGSLSQIMAFNTFIPSYDANHYNLGSSTNRWYNLYLANNLSDGTNSITVAEIVAKQDAIPFRRFI